MTSKNNIDNKKSVKKQKERISSTNLLLTITIVTFIGMYVLAMLVWGGGFLNPQQFYDLFNNNAYLIVISCGLTVVMIAGGIDISVGGIIALVTMTEPGFLTPRIVMQVCSASIITPQPCAWSLSMSMSAIWLVRRS